MEKLTAEMLITMFKWMPGPWSWKGLALCHAGTDIDDAALLSANQASPYAMSFIKMIPEMVAELVKTEGGRKVLGMVEDDIRVWAFQITSSMDMELARVYAADTEEGREYREYMKDPKFDNVRPRIEKLAEMFIPNAACATCGQPVDDDGYCQNGGCERMKSRDAWED
jgi:hypothetical protein